MPKVNIKPHDIALNSMQRTVAQGKLSLLCLGLLFSLYLEGV